MGAKGPDSTEIEDLRTQKIALQKKDDELIRENEALKEKLQKYENGVHEQ